MDEKLKNKIEELISLFNKMGDDLAIKDILEKLTQPEIELLGMLKWKFDDKNEWFNSWGHGKGDERVEGVIEGIGERITHIDGKLGDDITPNNDYREWHNYSFGYDNNGILRSIDMEKGYPMTEKSASYIILNESGNKMFETIYAIDTYGEDEESAICYSEDGKIIAKKTLVYPHPKYGEEMDINGILIHNDMDSEGNESRVGVTLEFYDAEKNEFTTHKKCSELSDREKEFLAIAYFEPFPRTGDEDFKSYMGSIEYYKVIVSEYCRLKGTNEIDGYELEVLSQKINEFPIYLPQEIDKVSKIIGSIKDRGNNESTITLQDIKRAVDEHVKEENEDHSLE